VNNLLTEIYLKYTLYSKLYVNIYVALLVEISKLWYRYESTLHMDYL